MKNIKISLNLSHRSFLATSCGNKEANTDQGSDTATEKATKPLG